LRDRLLDGIRRELGLEQFVVNTPLDAETRSAPHVLNVAFPPSDGEPVDGEMLLLNMDMKGICASNGSACTSGAMEPSHVLEAIGLPAETASAALRFSLGKNTTPEEVDAAAEAVGEVVGRMCG
jgi:cysteine desulfurase